MSARRTSDDPKATEPDPVDFLLQVVLPSTPDVATRGDVVVTVLEVGVDIWVGAHRTRTGEWDGAWPRLEATASLTGTRAEVVDWATARDAAAAWIYDAGTSSFVPLA